MVYSGLLSQVELALNQVGHHHNRDWSADIQTALAGDFIVANTYICMLYMHIYLYLWREYTLRYKHNNSMVLKLCNLKGLKQDRKPRNTVFGGLQTQL